MLQVLVAITQKFCCIKEEWGYAKDIHKKREIEKKEMRKNGQLFEILKQWVLRCLPKKR